MTGPARESTGILWEGSFFVYHSLAVVNRELALALLQTGAIELGITPAEGRAEPELLEGAYAALLRRVNVPPPAVDFYIRHRWPPSFDEAGAPLITVLPWEWGSIPRGWAEAASSCREVWVPSGFVRNSFVQGGVDPFKVHVVPNGVNPRRFNPSRKPLKLPSTGGFKFLFVGGLLYRKGIDALVRAYTEEFSASDDVSLVVKVFGGERFYTGQGNLALIEEAQSRAGAPEIVLLKDNLRDDQMGRLYRACDCLVHPYRGEGFALPVLEAMACGLPAIVTGYGACLDFCTPDNAYLIDGRPFLVEGHRVGVFDTVDHPYLAEPDVSHLRHLMRHAYENREEAAAVGDAASREVLRRFNWACSAERALGRLRDLKERPAATGLAAEELVRRGVELFNAGDHQGAMRVFEEARRLDPGEPDVHFNLGYICYGEGSYLEGAAHFVRSLEARVRNAETWLMLGNALNLLGDLGSARRAYGMALKIDSSLQTAWSNLSDLVVLERQIPDLWRHGYFRAEIMRLEERFSRERRLLVAREAKGDVRDGERNGEGVPVVWRGHYWEGTGYGDASRGYLAVLDPSRFNLRLAPEGKRFDEAGIIPGELRRRFRECEANPLDEREAIVVYHTPAHGFASPPRGAVNVGRVAFETDRIPADWVEHCNRMDRVWVPSRFNLETFARSGVSPEKLRVLPEGIEPSFLAPAEPMTIPGCRGFRFLSVFDWIDRKGWEFLVTAYLAEFRAEEDVALIIKAYKVASSRPGEVEHQLLRFIVDKLGMDPGSIPDIVLLKGFIEAEKMPSLYAAADAFVLPSRGEGWGRPYLEAMACGLPTIGTRWSGQLDFMNDDNSFLIDLERIEDVPEDVDMPVYRGHKWARPSVDHLRRLMRLVYENRELAARVGARAREDVLGRWTLDHVRPVLEGHLMELVPLLGRERRAEPCLSRS